YGSENVHLLVRLLIVNEILLNPHLYEHHIANKYNATVDLQEYVYMMSKCECRCDHITLRAFSNAFRANLFVYSTKIEYTFKISCINEFDLHKYQVKTSYSILIASEWDHISLVTIDNRFNNKSNVNMHLSKGSKHRK